jgi:hypothetical protein
MRIVFTTRLPSKILSEEMTDFMIQFIPLNTLWEGMEAWWLLIFRVR